MSQADARAHTHTEENEGARGVKSSRFLDLFDEEDGRGGGRCYWERVHVVRHSSAAVCAGAEVDGAEAAGVGVWVCGCACACACACACV